MRYMNSSETNIAAVVLEMSAEEDAFQFAPNQQAAS